MIKTHKEPQGLSGAQLERCTFCYTPTEYWDKSATFPVCEYCSEIKDETDLDAIRKEVRYSGMEQKPMTQPTLSPRTLGVYYGQLVLMPNGKKISTGQALGGSSKSSPTPGKLILKRQPFHSNHARNLSLFDDMRKDGYDMGGFIIQNGTETWVASLIDAGVAVEMEVGK